MIKRLLSRLNSATAQGATNVMQQTERTIAIQEASERRRPAPRIALSWSAKPTSLGPQPWCHHGAFKSDIRTGQRPQSGLRFTTQPRVQARLVEVAHLAQVHIHCTGAILKRGKWSQVRRILQQNIA